MSSSSSSFADAKTKALVPRSSSSSGRGGSNGDEEHRESGSGSGRHGRTLSDLPAPLLGGNGRDEWRLIQWTQNAAAAMRERLRFSEERRPEVPRYVVVGVTAIAVLSVLTGYGAGGVCNLAGFVYPLYMSWKAVRSVDLQDDSQWLTYWVVYGFLNVTESWTRMFGLTALPFYSALKVSFLLWCFFPKTRGADVIFHRVITPLLVKYEQRIDRFVQWWIGETQAAARDAMNQTGGELSRRFTKIGGNFIRAVTDSVADMKNGDFAGAGADASRGAGNNHSGSGAAPSPIPAVPLASVSVNPDAVASLGARALAALNAATGAAPAPAPSSNSNPNSRR